MTLCECLRRCTGMCNESIVTCMKELWMVAMPQIRCQLHDHAKQYDYDEACHNKRNGGKLHGNISRNGYGNAIIGRYGGCFEEDVWNSVSYHGVWMHRRSLHQLSRWERAMHDTEEASNDGKVKVCIIHGLNISHKELTYLSKNLQVIKTKHYVHAPRGLDW